MIELLRFSTLDHPEYSEISGEYRVRLERYLEDLLRYFEMSGRVIFYHTIENNIPVYVISSAHVGVHRVLDSKKLLEVFETYVEENPIHTCVYCGETISDKNYKFCDNYICSVCEKTAKSVLLQNRMKKDLEEWENR